MEIFESRHQILPFAPFPSEQEGRPIKIRAEKREATAPLHAALVGRGTVDGWDRDPVEAQIDAELGAMMNVVIHHEGAKHGDVRHGEDRNAVFQE